MSYAFRSLLVTGGAGFIGCNFLRFLMQQHPAVRVVNLDLLTYAGETENLKGLPPNPNYHFVQGDICDRQRVRSLLEQHEVDTIVHFAAESHVDRSISGPGAFIQTNIVGTFTLLDEALRYWRDRDKLNSAQSRFHHVSTDEVYGSLGPDDPAFREETAYQPNSPYSASKASSDHLARAYAKTYGLPVTISHCSNNYGPYQHFEKFIPTVIRSGVQQKPIPVYGTGLNVRDWLHVLDHCRGILRIVEDGAVGECYNLGGNCELSNLELAQRICSTLDSLRPIDRPYASLIQFVSDRLGHDFRYAVSLDKVERELNWKPLCSFDEGIKTTIEWYLENL